VKGTTIPGTSALEVKAHRQPGKATLRDDAGRGAPLALSRTHAEWLFRVDHRRRNDLAMAHRALLVDLPAGCGVRKNLCRYPLRLPMAMTRRTLAAAAGAILWLLSLAAPAQQAPPAAPAAQPAAGPAQTAAQPAVAPAPAAPAQQAAPEPFNPDSATCLACHGNQGFSVPAADGKGERSLFVHGENFAKSKHGSMPCILCHQAITAIPHPETAKAAKVDCGMCHADQKAEYLKSVHGVESVQNRNPNAATCKDCHGTHEIASPKDDATKIAIVKNCGSCHVDRFKSYGDTYHGQVHTLGYAYTAKCFDCHGSHGIQSADNPISTVHPDNRLQTCQKCHANATKGFVTFQPHANTHDFKNYPEMWIVSKFMIALIIGVFAFFWTHSVLWFYAEWRDRKNGVPRAHIVPGELPPGAEKKYFQRFRPVWRIAHLGFALCLMVLAATGMAVYFGKTLWAGGLMRFLGGPQEAAKIHRIAAVIILTIFVAQMLYFAIKLIPNWRTFKWFGHTSLIPSFQDLRDIVAQFKWFFGKGPRPVFGRWNYLERFDYWAPFWGLFIVGGSGLMLWFKEATAAVWPGWMFNVAMLAHGEEAFLAIVFLFTVHFFNNHFRPDKLPPPDIVMFTGAVDLEHFKREHTLEYEELVRTGQLEKHLVDVPSPAMTLGARILGIILLGIGLTLLVLVLSGFVQSFWH
jgi:cytochrome b subunit of formate dehydrogenase